MVTIEMENWGKIFERMEKIEDHRDGELLLLDESDIVGASYKESFFEPSSKVSSKA